MKRRSFFASLAGIPFLGKVLPKLGVVPQPMMYATTHPVVSIPWKVMSANVVLTNRDIKMFTDDKFLGVLEARNEAEIQRMAEFMEQDLYGSPKKWFRT